MAKHIGDLHKILRFEGIHEGSIVDPRRSLSAHKKARADRKRDPSGKDVYIYIYKTDSLKEGNNYVEILKS